MRDRYDLVVVGGGPAGLHAALKAAVLNQTVLLVDKGPRFSRIHQAPSIANLPGMPGLSGPDLLQRLRADLDEYARLSGKDLVDVAEGTEAAQAARTEDGRFRVGLRPLATGGASLVVESRVVVLATGIVDAKPGVVEFAWRGHETMAPFVRRGEVGYCILCEGWSLDGARVAVLASEQEGAQIAHDLQAHFGAEVALLPVGLAPLESTAAAAEAGVRVERRAVRAMCDVGGRLEVRFEDGSAEIFDKAMLCMGFHAVNSALAVQLGARVTREGYVATNEDCEALDERGEVIRGLYAIGDVRDNKWKQIVVSWGEAERAVIAAYAHRLPD